MEAVAVSERISSVQDGVTNRTEVSYSFDENFYWRVTTRSVVGPSTNSVTATRAQLTGLSDALRSRTISVSADGVATTNSVSFNPNTLVETSVTSSPAFGTRVARGVCGLVLEEETADETIAHVYDPHGREERTDRRAHGEADFRTVAEFVYSPMGDLVERRTYTNATDYVTERFAYDHEGREIASTNSLGGVVTTSYDPRGNVTAVDGATYPLRMEYDLKGRRTALKTTRDGESWDETRWTLDPATGLCLSKTYADGSTVSYTYTPDGLPARTTWPGGRWQENGYNARREVVSTERSDGEETAFAYDAYSRETAAANDSASIEYARDDRGRATNVTTTVAGTTHSLMREFDNAGRLARSGDLFHEYDSEGRLAVVSNSIAAVEYQYAADGRDAGYTLTLHNGSVFARSVARDAMRRSLVTGITSSMNNNPVESIAYSYDALGRPTNRNNDAFGYNDRSEVTSASIMGWAQSPSTASYGYDDIGNLQQSMFNAATNAYTANSLNQYTSIQEISAPSASSREPTYDLDGNMLSDGVLSFTYDAASRLKTVSSNGVTLVTNFYDAKSRRVKKVTPNATTTFFYDDWNLVEERIAYADNTTSTIRYYWGKDLSGTLQGAGGVGGLLWLTVDGTIYIPCYDNNGNVTRYLSVNGGALARYSYDAFGKLIAKSGRRSSLFRHRFSTKYFDSETGLYYYGYRFYHPGLMRWLNRDPIEEEGGMNLYAMCENKAISCTDSVGHAVFLVLAGLDNNESVFIKQKNVMANSLRTTIRSLVLLNSLTEKQYECLKGNKAIRFNDQPFGGTLGEYKKLIERELKSYVRVSHDYGESLTAIRSMANQMEKSWDYLVYFVHGGNGKRWGVRTIISFSDGVYDQHAALDEVSRNMNTSVGTKLVISCFQTWDGQGETPLHQETISHKIPRFRFFPYGTSAIINYTTHRIVKGIQ